MDALTNDQLGHGVKNLLAEAQPRLVSSLTYISIMSRRMPDGRVVLLGFIEVKPIGEKRLQEWLPGFEWTPVEGGGLRSDAVFNHAIADAASTSGAHTILHENGKLRVVAGGGRKRVSRHSQKGDGTAHCCVDATSPLLALCPQSVAVITKAAS